MKNKLKALLFGISIYLGICTLAATVGAMENMARDMERIDCSKFYAVEIIIPVTPIACALSKQVYP